MESNWLQKRVKGPGDATPRPFGAEARVVWGEDTQRIHRLGARFEIPGLASLGV